MSQPVITFHTERVDDVGGDDVMHMGAAPAAPGAICLNRLPIRSNSAIRLLDIRDIVAATASNTRVEVMTVEATYPTYYTLSELEQRLPSGRFLRVHDGWIVNLAQITEIHHLSSQSYQLRLRSSNRLVPVSRRRYCQLQRLFGF